MIELMKKRPIKKNIEKDCFYIWAPQKGRESVVYLNKDGDGIVEITDYGYGEHWYFSDKLIGFVYGPFTLAKAMEK